MTQVAPHRFRQAEALAIEMMKDIEKAIDDVLDLYFTEYTPLEDQKIYTERTTLRQLTLYSISRHATRAAAASE